MRDDAHYRFGNGVLQPAGAMNNIIWIANRRDLLKI